MSYKNCKLWEVWGQTNALYMQWCSGRDVNSYRQLVLYALDSHEPTTQKRIADYTGLSKQTVATVMRSLKAEGFVTLSPGSGDRREKIIRLTDKGTQYAENVLHDIYTLEKRVFAIMGQERIQLFNTVFEKEMEEMQDEQQK